MKGRCLCGAIEIETEPVSAVTVCHCAMCRGWGSGPMFALHCGHKVTFHGAKPQTYQSSEWAERGFCPNCGSHLFYRLLLNGEYSVSAGLFQQHDFNLESEIFVDDKPGFYDFANDTHKMTGQQAVDIFTNQMKRNQQSDE